MDGPRHLGARSRADSGEIAGSHVPVLFQPVLDLLRAVPGSVIVDGTVGGGGHAEGILRQSAPDGRLVGLDRDPAALEAAQRRLACFGERVILRHGSFANLLSLAGDVAPVDGVLLDLGLSSLQLADPERGFSFTRDGRLDMRFDPTGDEPTAADLVNRLAVKELVDVLYQYGEERQARRVAEAIAAARPLWTTAELAEVVAAAIGGAGRRIHPATRTFQALRIAVNDELGALEKALPAAVEMLAPGGRLVVISFHSLEDRIVKQFLRREARDCICPPELPVCMCDHRARLQVLTPRPIRPGEDELKANPRSRSARLRAAERIDEN